MAKELEDSGQTAPGVVETGGAATFPESIDPRAPTDAGRTLPESIGPPDGDDETFPGALWAQTDTARELRPGLPARYEALARIGVGGMGEVWRAHDRQLDRLVVIKTLRQDRPEPTLRARFLKEAVLTAQLQHPAIVPVHDTGSLDDGTPFYVMKEVQGRTLAERIAEAHHALRDGRQVAWPPHRLIDALLRASEGVAHAHGEGVIHRDIKPANMMIGQFGEAMILDWGIARRQRLPVQQRLPLLGAAHLDAGASGTPAYMAPEQAAGLDELLGPATDVYALGGVLVEILTGGPPHRGVDARSARADVLFGPGPSLRAAPRAVPPDLEEIVSRAMARDPADRYAHAGAFAEALRRWREGDLRRDRARALVERARYSLPELDGLRRRAASLRTEARAALEALPAHAPVEQKAAGWALEDEAEQVARSAAVLEVGVTQLLGAAISEDEQLDEAHQLLADLMRIRHEEAEERRDRGEALRLEALLKTHDRGRHTDYLRGDGTLSLATEPAGAEVLLHRFESVGRRQVPDFLRTLGRTPLVDVVLPAGSYLLVLRREGFHDALYPVRIERGEALRVAPPGSDELFSVPLLPLGSLGPEDRYVPAGFARLGGSGRNALPASRSWVDGFVMRRHPVTVGEYIAFLDALVAAGREAEALSRQPRLSPTGGRGEQAVLGRDAAGHFLREPDPEGDVWGARWPVFHVDWRDACAFAAWEAGRSGLAWRLPREREREKAGRGADGRLWPWGDWPEPTWTANAQARPGRATPRDVGDPPEDESLYGICGLAGNARDWCLDLRNAEDTDWRVTRGGAWSAGLAYGQLDSRLGAPADFRNALIGFRLARSV